VGWTRQLRRWLQGPNRTSSPKLPRYLLLVFGVLIGCSVAIAGTLTLARHRVQPSIPFSAFKGVFPGQPKSAVLAHGFSCARQDTMQHEYCILNLETGPFSNIGVVLDNDEVRQIEFTLPQGVLRLGDLVVLLGSPDDQIDVGTTRFFFWSRHDIVAETNAYRGYMSFELSIEMVALRNAFIPALLTGHESQSVEQRQTGKQGRKVLR
jgi:hypothetical protein